MLSACPGSCSQGEPAAGKTVSGWEVVGFIFLGIASSFIVSSRVRNLGIFFSFSEY